jgi:mannose-6-phosphate isomerase-like protein (cupin superfamily)
MYWLLFLLFLVAVLLYLWPRTRTITLPLFLLADFQRSCGTVSLRIEYFRDPQGQAILEPTARKDVLLQDWITDPSGWSGWASKLKWRPHSQHPIARYMDAWLTKHLTSLPVALQERLGRDSNTEFCLRLSNGSWHYPNHYDCVDNYALVLAGERHVSLERGTPRILSTGDFCYIPAGQEHEFWCTGSASQVNILFNVDFNLPPTERLACRTAFDRQHPYQAARVAQFDEYT